MGFPGLTPDCVELAELFAADQAARSDPSADWRQVVAADAVRRRRVRELLAAGAATRPDDLVHAAMVLHHGDCFVDHRDAHRLSRKALALAPGNRQARWLYAVTLDRCLWALGRRQRFGTQVVREGERWVVHRFDPSVTDADRAYWGVPTLAASLQRARQLNDG